MTTPPHRPLPRPAGPPDRSPASEAPSPDVHAAAKPRRPISLARASWSITALVFLVVGVILLWQGYGGYAIVTLVIGVAAAINLL